LKRKNTKSIKIGSVSIGGGYPVAIQSMTKTKTLDIKNTIKQIKRLKKAGCDIVRCAIPDTGSAKALKSIKKETNIPVVADIHFNYKLAINAMENGADKIRINPGNIGSEKHLKEIIKKAKEFNIPIRIGINSGSLEKDILSKYGYPSSEAMIESAKRNIDFFESEGFFQIIISLKSSDVQTTINAYREISEVVDYPLHIGITEAGTPFRGTIKSSIGIGALLLDGIGDTIRVSLTGDPVKEVLVAKEIMRSLHLYNKGVDLISCPTCGRIEVDLIKIVSVVEKKISKIDKQLKVAIMGCVVNGPGEAKDADIGIACGKGFGLLFKKGKIIEKIKENNFIDRLIKEIENWH